MSHIPIVADGLMWETLDRVAHWVGYIAFAGDGLMLLLGSATVSLSLFLIFRTSRRLITWRRAEARIEGFKREEGYFFPKFSFVTSSGESIATSTLFGRGVRGCRKGDLVRIIYDPRKPEHAEIFSFMSLGMPVIMVTVIAAVFLLVTVHNWDQLFELP